LEEEEMFDHHSTRDDLVRELNSARKQLAEIQAIVSEQERLREALSRDRERYQKIFHGSNDAILVIDADQDLILDVNPKACEILGYSRRELLAKRATDIHPQEMPQFRAFASRVMEDGSGWTDELTCMTKVGQYLQAEISASTVEFEGRTCVIAMVRDISERKRAEQAIKMSEEKYRSLYHHTPVMMHSINRSGKLIRVNHFWLSVLGYERDEVIGRQVTDFLNDRYRKLAMTVHLPKLLQTGTVTDVELQMVKSDGNVIDALLSAVAIRDDAGEMDHSVAFVIDVTESKAAARALMESEKRLSRILESAMDAIITIDDDRRIVLFNEAAEKTFQGSRAKALNQPIDLFLSEKFRNLLTNYLKDFHGRKKNRPYIWAPGGLTAIRSNREEFPVEATISHVRVSDRNLYTIILRDINERLQAKAELRKLHLPNIYLQEEIETEFNFGEIVGASAAMKEVFRNIEKVAPTDSTVLVTGETGTGKELVARAIHNTSTRTGVLIKVNCGALPSGLVESELFGHEKGAFTGAVAEKKVVSSLRTPVRFSWMRLASYRWKHRLNCCGFCRSRSSSAWEGPKRSKSTCGSLRLATAISRKPSSKVFFARTFSIA
jgi:PAS domain S-box-containing protein